MKNLHLNVNNKYELDLSLGNVMLTTGPVCQFLAYSKFVDDLYLLTPVLLLTTSIEAAGDNGLKWVDFYYLGLDASKVLVLSENLDKDPSDRRIIFSNKRNDDSLTVDNESIRDIIAKVRSYNRFINEGSYIYKGFELFPRLVRMKGEQLCVSGQLYFSGTRIIDAGQWPRSAVRQWIGTEFSLSTAELAELDTRMAEFNTSTDLVVHATKKHISKLVIQGRRNNKAKAEKKNPVPEKRKRAALQNSISCTTILNGHTYPTSIVCEQDVDFKIDITGGLEIDTETFFLHTTMGGVDFGAATNLLDHAHYPGILRFYGVSLCMLHSEIGDLADPDNYIGTLRIMDAYGDTYRLIMGSSAGKRLFYLTMAYIQKELETIHIRPAAQDLIEEFYEESIAMRPPQFGERPHATAEAAALKLAEHVRNIQRADDPELQPAPEPVPAPIPEEPPVDPLDVDRDVRGVVIAKGSIFDVTGTIVITQLAYRTYEVAISKVALVPPEVIIQVDSQAILSTLINMIRAKSSVYLTVMGFKIELYDGPYDGPYGGLVVPADHSVLVSICKTGFGEYHIRMQGLVWRDMREENNGVFFDCVKRQQEREEQYDERALKLQMMGVDNI